MAIFSTSQNRQFYVAASYAASKAALVSGTKGSGAVYASKDANGSAYIQQLGFGGIVRSDLIANNSIMWAKASTPDDSAIALKSIKIELDSNLNDGDPIVGQDYILRIVFSDFSKENEYIKDAAVHVTAGMEASDFYTAMAASLVRNLKKVYSPEVTISSDSAGSNVAVRVANVGGVTKLYDATGSEVTFTNAIYINEADQSSRFARGTKGYKAVNFEVIPTTVYFRGSDMTWGVVSDNTATYAATVNNGVIFADLEYFCMGERGDQYRNAGWPYVIPTQYFVNPSSAYYCLDIHYAYQGNCEDVQKSEKTMTIVATTKAILDSIITALGIGSIVEKTPNWEAEEDDED